jgi:hypothetical protein
MWTLFEPIHAVTYFAPGARGVSLAKARAAVVPNPEPHRGTGTRRRGLAGLTGMAR